MRTTTFINRFTIIWAMCEGWICLDSGDTEESTLLEVVCDVVVMIFAYELLCER